jgi:hypothetical protein
MEVSGQLHAPAALPPGKEPLVPIGWGAGWVPEPFTWVNLGVDGRVILEWILENYGMRVRNGFSWLRIESSGGPMSM